MECRNGTVTWNGICSDILFDISNTQKNDQVALNILIYPSRPNLGGREKIYLNSLFLHFFVVLQRSVKIKNLS